MKERSENRLPKPDRPVSAASQYLSQAEDNTDRYRLRVSPAVLGLDSLSSGRMVRTESGRVSKIPPRRQFPVTTGLDWT